MRRAAWPPRAPNGSRSLHWRGSAREWRDLVARALEPNVFYDPAFTLPAARVFGADVGAVLVWSKTASRLIGLFPARVERRYGMMGTLTGWTHPYAPFGVPLVDREEAEAAIGAFLDHVAAERAFPKLVMLPLIARDGPFAAALARVLARRGVASANFGEHARALLAPRRRENYLDQINGKKLKELRRQRRRLEDSGALVHMAASGPAAAVALSDFMALEAAGWKGRAGGAARAAFGDRSVHARGRDRARHEGRCARRPAHSRRTSGRGVDHAAQRLRRVVLEDHLRRGVRARVAGRAAHARSHPRSHRRRRAGADQLVRHRRASDDRSSVEGAPDALRHADRAKRGIDGESPHRAAARSIAARRHRGGEKACATG